MSNAEHRIDVGTASASYSRDTSGAQKGCLTCLSGALMTSGVLILLAICVSNICFGISGVVFLAEEYTDIPDCASSFRGWGIAMTTLFILSLQSAKKSDRSDISMRAFGVALMIMSFIPGLIAGLGNRDVLKAHDGCDRSAIPQLITWTEWIVVYNVVLFVLMVVGGGVIACSAE